MTSNKTQIINMLIIAVAIVLISAAKVKFNEMFVAQVPHIPFDQGYGAQGGSVPPIRGGYPVGQPRIFENQIYPARIPYYNEMGRPCNSVKDCGSMGVCKEGHCKTIPYENSVFNVPVHGYT